MIMSQLPPLIRILLYQENISNIQNLSNLLKNNAYHGAITSIVHKNYQREFETEPMKTKHLCFSRSDLLLSSNDWYSKVISIMSDYGDCDSEVDEIRKASEKALIQEISFSDHLVQAWGGLLVKVKSKKCVNLARILMAHSKSKVFVEIPMVDPKYLASQYRIDKVNQNDDYEDTWTWWNNFRTYADYNPKIKLALELSSDIPTSEELHRWLGEPIHVLIIPANVFIMNSSNCPVLSRAHQEVLLQFIRHNINFAIKANVKDGYLNFYSSYIKYLVDKFQQIDPMKGFDDVLEYPLQPLYDNLDSYTYETFERDPVKYKKYQEAIEAALLDRVPQDQIKTKTSVIMVLGAGRGPLVRAALNASQNTSRKIKIFVIEKNPNAIITLQSLIDEMWADRDVRLFKCDMRDFDPPEKADILVSELLGAFGDNELSPECLDGAQKHLKVDGISIPCKSTSYINPTMSTKVFNAVRYVERPSNARERMNCYSNQAESTYVLYIKNCYHISKPKTVFEFVHPNLNTVIDNSRFISIDFEVKVDCVLTGFSGYFDSVLYKDITISTHPETHTPGMASWFTLFFPMAEPQHLKAGDIIVLNIWRCVGAHKVWYEWCTVAPIISHIHNHMGRSSFISM